MNIRYHLVWTAALVLWLFAGAGHAQEGPVSSIEEAVRAALVYNPGYHDSQASLAAIKENKEQGLAAMRPNVHLQAETNHQYLGHDDDRLQRTYHRASYGVTLTQPLYRPQLYHQYRHATPLIAATSWELEAVTANLVMQVAELYINVLKAREVAVFARHNHDLTKEFIEAIRMRFQVGNVTKTDVDQAVARMAAAEAERLQAANNVIVQETQFREITGATIAGRPQAIQLASPVFDMPYNELAVMRVERAEFKVAQAMVRAHIIQVDINQAEHMPVINLEANAKQMEDQDNLYGDDYRDLRFVVSFSVPLYQGHGTTSRVRQARFKHQGAEERLKQVTYQIDREIRQAHLELGNTRAKVSAYKISTRAAKSAVEGVEAEFRVGTKTSLDLLNAQNELFNTQTRLTTERYNLIIAQFRLLQSIGRIESVFGDVIP